MSTLCWTICKTLLNKQSPPQQKKLLGFLSASSQSLLQKAPLQKDIVLTFSPDEVLDAIHPSWLKTLLLAYTDSEKGFFLAALSSTLATHLQKLFQLQSPLPVLTDLGKRYLRGVIFDLIRKNRGEALPKAALPDSPLNSLLELDSSHLSLLAFFLGLHDFADELHFVIDKQTLLYMESALTSIEWQTVKKFAARKEKVTFGRMHLKKDDKSAQQLRLLIEQYGINRMAKALYGKNPSMLWHLLLHFDPQRASYFSKLCTPPSKPEIQEHLQQQILTLIPQLAKGVPKER